MDAAHRSKKSSQKIPSSNVDESSSSVRAPEISHHVVHGTPPALQPSCEKFIVNDILIGLRYIPSNGIYTHQKLEDMKPTTNRVIPSEMLYIQVGDDYGGGYEKIAVYLHDKRSLIKLTRQAKKVRKSRLKSENKWISSGCGKDEMPPAYYPSSVPLVDSNNPESSQEDIIIVTTPDPYDIIMDISPSSDSGINTCMSAEGVKTIRYVDLKSTSLNENESNDE
jgi:hypothetical protein